MTTQLARVPIRNLFVTCAFTSGHVDHRYHCWRPAEYGVLDEESGNVWYRCYTHRTVHSDGTFGYWVTAVTRKVEPS